MSLVSCVEVCRAMKQAPVPGPSLRCQHRLPDSLLSSPTTHPTTIMPPASCRLLLPHHHPASLPNHTFFSLLPEERQQREDNPGHLRGMFQDSIGVLGAHSAERFQRSELKDQDLHQGVPRATGHDTQPRPPS